jgi:hypothetical protein
MFAVKVAKPQQAATHSTYSLEPQRAMVAKRSVDHEPDERRGSSQNDIRAEPEGVGARGASGWSLSRVPISPPRHPGQSRPFHSLARFSVPQGIRPKLALGPVDDPLEREADAIADQVTETLGVTLPVSTASAQISRKCAACEEDEKQQKLRTKPAATTRPAGEAPPIIDEVLRSSGEPLDAETRVSMETSFGYDFSGVRLHTGARAAQSVREIGARAYAAGRNIVFADGEYAPHTHIGRHLLAHELAHVVQCDGRQDQPIKRQACGHDAPRGSGCGRLQAPRGEDLVEIGADRVIAEAMGDHFPGTWIGQVYSPPNPVKGGKMFGLVDAMKVTADSNLVLDVAEVKSRNIGEGTGGCQLATQEAQGYVSVLQPLAPRMAAISKGLEKIGGLNLPDCRKFNKAIEAQLRAAGVDTSNDQDMFAWCVLNSIQEKTRKPITKGFDTVSVRTSTDGAAKTDYLALTLPYECKVKGKPGVGIYQMFYQVNTTGGVSYRCEKTCQPQDEDEKRKQKDISKDLKLDTGERDETFQITPVGDEDPKENVEIREPGTGIDVTDVAIYATATVAATAALNLAYRKAKTKAEQEIARKAAERLALELEERGAVEVAKTLDSKNLSKLGTEAYEKVLLEAEKKAAKRLAEAGEEQIAKKLAVKLGESAAKKGAKTLLEKGTKAIPYLGLAITIYELGSAADAYAKGADIEFGLSGNDVNLSGDTNVDVKGGKGKGGVTSDVKLTDTQIDMEVTAPPDAGGVIELEAKKASIQGKMPAAEGSQLTVNLKVKLDNATIVYKSIGRLKGGHVLIDGALDIKDSTIEIDIPEGTDVDVPEGGETPRQITGIKVKITKPGSGIGTVEPGKEPAKGATKGGTETPPPDPDAAERAKLLSEIEADSALKKVYETYFTRKGTPALETLRRLTALKARLRAHPELLEKILGQVKAAGGEVKDPVKEFIEPLERALDEAEKPQQTKPPEKATPGDKPGAPPPGKEPEQTKPPEGTAPSDKPGTAPPGKENAPPATATDKGNATALELLKIIKSDYLKRSDVDPDNADAPTAPAATVRIPVHLPRETKKGHREYHFYLDATLVKARDKSHMSGQFEFSGDYSFHPPDGVLLSTQKDEPIYFTDADKTQTVEWGLLKKKHRPHAPKKKP